LGISWLVAAYALQKVLFNDSARCLLLSQSEPDAWRLLEKATFVLRNLPEFLQYPTAHDARGELNFKCNSSVIQALPSTDRAGRGIDATLVIRDELAEHEYGEQNFRAIGPAVDSGGQLVDLGTINKFDDKNHLTERVNKLRDGAQREDLPSGLVVFKKERSILIFAGWDLRPIREEGETIESWFESNVKAKYDSVTIEQEYPRTIEEALSAPKTSCRFDVASLNRMASQAISPMEIRQNGLVKIYRRMVAGRRACFAIDCSEGEYDPSAGVIVDAQTLEELVSFHGKITIDEQAYIISDLYDEYKKPLIAVERNAAGLTLISKLLDMGITNWYYDAKDKPGWYTSGGRGGGGNRGKMLAALADSIFTGEARIYNPEAIDEFRTFIRTPERQDGVARGGCHDDFVLAWAIANQIRKNVHVGVSRGFSFKYKE